VAELSSTFKDVNKHSNLNFGNRLTQHKRKQDRESAVEGIKKDKELGIDLIDLLNKVKRVTASSLIQGGSYVIGKEVLEVVKDRTNLKRLEIQQQKDKEEWYMTNKYRMQMQSSIRTKANQSSNGQRLI
jgi:hypothetical protein